MKALRLILVLLAALTGIQLQVAANEWESPTAPLQVATLQAEQVDELEAGIECLLEADQVCHAQPSHSKWSKLPRTMRAAFVHHAQSHRAQRGHTSHAAPQLTASKPCDTSNICTCADQRACLPPKTRRAQLCIRTI